MSNPYATDPDKRNDDRAKMAADAIKRLRVLSGADREDALCDLLCNLRHYADRDGFDFRYEFSRAMRHYRAETSYHWDAF